MEMSHYDKKTDADLPSINGELANSGQENDIKTLITSFGSYTTLHGFHFLVESGSVVRRILWLLLMMVCLLILTLQLRGSFAKLRTYDSMVTKDIEHSQKLLFPAVSICNQNMLRRRKINGTDAQLYLDGLDYIGLQNNPTGIKQAAARMNFSFDIEKAVREAGHNLTTMLLDCSWKREKCGPENFTSFVSFYRGLCYTFNSGAPGHPLLYAEKSGMTQALSLLMNVQPEEYYGPFSYEATGIKVILHEQHELPEVESCGLDVSPGLNTNIRIKRNKLISLEAPFRPACGTKPLLTSKVYSTSRCLSECNVKRLIELCKCRFLAMPVAEEFNVIKFCNLDELRTCVLPSYGKHRSYYLGSYIENRYNKFHKDGKRRNSRPILASGGSASMKKLPQKGVIDMSECNCPGECEKVTYSTSHSSAYFPSPHFWDTIFQLVNTSVSDVTETTKLETHEFMRKRLLKLNIFYQSLSTEVTEQKPTYDIHDFAADIGGNMGLFLGCSVLTVFEFVDLLIRICATSLRRKDSKKMKSKDTHL